MGPVISQSGAEAWLRYPVFVGGIACTCADVSDALEILKAAAGLMVRQPLAKASNILAGCDYHAAAAPYKARYAAVSVSAGRGAAGRHITKQAFCYALSAELEAARTASPVAAFAGVTQRAWAAFASDFRYAEAMARSAIQLRGGLPVSSADYILSAEPGSGPGLRLEVIAPG